MPKVLIVNEDFMTKRMFMNRGWEVVYNEEPDLIQFTGGSDVTPSLYGQDMHPQTLNNPERDEREVEIFKLYKGYPMAGICRGAQFLHVMNGGEMYQHVDNHAIQGTHPVFIDGKIVQCTSTHHQMMKYFIQSEVIGHSVEAKNKEFMKDGEIVTKWGGYDLEIVLYPNTLCFQPHPEYGVEECEELYFNLLRSELCVG